MSALSFPGSRRIKFLPAADLMTEKEIPLAYRDRMKPRPLRCAMVLVCVSSLILAGTLLMSCGGGGTTTPSSPSVSLTPLSSADVQQVVQDAAQSANAPLVIAVADRSGKILAVFRNATAPLTSTGNFGATVDRMSWP